MDYCHDIRPQGNTIQYTFKDIEEYIEESFEPIPPRDFNCFINLTDLSYNSEEDKVVPASLIYFDCSLFAEIKLFFVYLDNLKRKVIPCPECSGKLILKYGTRGLFYGFSNFRNSNCHYTFSRRNNIDTKVLCDVCQYPMVVKLGLFGLFLGCSNFLNCHNTLRLD